MELTTVPTSSFFFLASFWAIGPFLARKTLGQAVDFKNYQILLKFGTVVGQAIPGRVFFFFFFQNFHLGLRDPTLRLFFIIRPNNIPILQFFTIVH